MAAVRQHDVLRASNATRDLRAARAGHDEVVVTASHQRRSSDPAELGTDVERPEQLAAAVVASGGPSGLSERAAIARIPAVEV